MRIKKYGIELVRLTENDIELVRHKRNSDAIRKTMLYQKIISKSEQKNWFKSIDNLKNWYFVVEVNGKKLGLIHGKVFDENEKNITFEGGVFFWDTDERTSIITTASSVVLTDFAFYFLEQKNIYAKVLKKNLPSLNYNKMMGFKVINECPDYFEMLLTAESYENKIKTIRKSLSSLNADYSELKIDDIYLSNSFREMILSESRGCEGCFSQALLVLTTTVS